MTKEFYYHQEDARSAAEQFAAGLSNPYISVGSVDDLTKFDYEDREARNLDWSGETSAFIVTGDDKDGNVDSGVFAYLE